MAVLSVINGGMLIIMQGKFIILEGIDGSGKTTIAEMLTDRLQQEGMGANFLNKKYSDYPEGFLREFTKKIGDALWTPTHGAPVTDVTDFGWYYLHATWYSVLANNALRNSLEEFEYTIMDGWYYKILARFLAKDKYEAADLALPFKHLPKGDLVMYLDIDPRIAVERKTGFSDAELGRNEGLSGDAVNDFIAYQSTVKDVYDTFARDLNWYRVDAGKTLDEVLESAYKGIELFADSNR